ncbi:hypothetical protein [Pedobacter sp. N23S346]|uniref:hypothetical protein n=1 Tax=Pedobacter sp. N23S346 TaxID=3402750 RepID=UPI003ACF20F8
MKSLLKLSSLLLLFPLLFVACKKENKDETPTGPLGPKYPQVINNVITPEILESLKKNGMTVNSGTTPPTINGVFLFSPAYCSFDNSGNNLQGRYFNDYKLQFKNQNTNEYTVSMEYKDVSDGTDSGGDNNATYISGENNLFTVFSQVKGKSGSVNYVALDVISGEAAGGSMKNLVWSHYLVSKEGDEANLFLVPVGTTRIFKDENGLSGVQTTFDVLPNNLQTIVKKSLSLSTAR